ncbi:hypothetical protein PQC07_gp165 [Aeromonas phage D3]|uniref:Virion structural protein n=1 Tax=Aeromonas phage D3 TaxID=2593327 RepID=A0A514TVQ2_9CAUD|nr:hypothetical protein PQC07_gp165 [Aeromonas phage D3]QDJ97108.1 hypothetical protein D3_0110 [Aeromonas phage D3]
MAQQIDNNRQKSILPNQLVSPTGIGVVVSAAINCNRPVDIPKYTTLNEHFNILADESIGKKNGKDFQLAYFGIGIGGSRSIGEDSFGLEDRKVNQHKATDFNAFHGIPFIARELSNDLDPVLRDQYRLRVVRKIGEKIYVLYFLKLINFDSFAPSMKVGTRDPATGNETSYPYEPKKEDLQPTPFQLTVQDSIPLSNTYVHGTGTLDLTLNVDDLHEIRNACRILYGNANKAAINEWYVCHGIETRNDGEIGEGGTVVYKELQSAVVSFNITEAWARDANANTKMPCFFEYGNSLPLLVGSDELAG